MLIVVLGEDEEEEKCERKKIFIGKNSLREEKKNRISSVKKKLLNFSNLRIFCDS